MRWKLIVFLESRLTCYIDCGDTVVSVLELKANICRAGVWAVCLGRTCAHKKPCVVFGERVDSAHSWRGECRPPSGISLHLSFLLCEHTRYFFWPLKRPVCVRSPSNTVYQLLKACHYQYYVSFLFLFFSLIPQYLVYYVIKLGNESIDSIWNLKKDLSH